MTRKHLVVATLLMALITLCTGVAAGPRVLKWAGGGPEAVYCEFRVILAPGGDCCWETGNILCYGCAAPAECAETIKIKFGNCAGLELARQGAACQPCMPIGCNDL